MLIQFLTAADAILQFLLQIVSPRLKYELEVNFTAYHDLSFTWLGILNTELLLKTALCFINMQR